MNKYKILLTSILLISSAVVDAATKVKGTNCMSANPLDRSAVAFCRPNHPAASLGLVNSYVEAQKANDCPQLQAVLGVAGECKWISGTDCSFPFPCTRQFFMPDPNDENKIVGGGDAVVHTKEIPGADKINTWQWKCPEGKVFSDNPTIYSCVWVLDFQHDKPSCEDPGGGNPIYPLTGVKRQSEILIPLFTGGAIGITYDTRRKFPGSLNGPIGMAAGPSPSFGELWESNLHKRLVNQVNDAMQAFRGSGAWLTFSGGNFSQNPNPSLLPDSDVLDHLYAVPGGSFPVGWKYHDLTTRSIETYSADGTLKSIAFVKGGSLTYTYSDESTPAIIAPKPGLLIKVTDHFGRSVDFQYEVNSISEARIVSVTDTNGNAIRTVYDSNDNLAGIIWPGGETRQFLYEDTNLPWALTGIRDENGSRHSTYGYDAAGRAISTELAGAVNRYSSSYTSPPGWSVTETWDPVRSVLRRDHAWVPAQGATMNTPTGVTNYENSLVQGKPRPTRQSQPAGSGCAASSSVITYDANANKSSADDFNGKRTCYAYDLPRNFEVVRVEGLGNMVTCSSVTPRNAALPSGSRKISTEWSPDGWKLERRRAEPGTLTTFVYNGQPDPFAGGALASCAPATALLPNGMPIAVLCRKVEQATTDADGHLGFDAALQPVPARHITRTYNQYGQVLTEDGPRNDVSDVTAYAYYADTTADHTLGDLQSVTNVSGKVTAFTKYNRHGQVLESTDPNGVQTVNTYDLRQRLLSTTTAGGTTRYTYDLVGQLKKITWPDAGWIGYDYDAAHRLVAVYDHLNNRIAFTLDNAGRRTGETVQDPGGALMRQLTRSIDALGRVQQTIGRE